MERHYEHDEREDNDLQNFLHNFGVFWDRYGNKLLTVLSILAIGFAVWSWVRRGKIEAREEALSLLSAASSPEALIGVADDHADQRPGDALLAYLKAGDLALFEAMDFAKPQEQRAQANVTAEKAYGRALAASATKPLFRVNALLGAASVAENQKDWDQAEGHYYEVITLAELSGFAFHQAKAQERLELLPQLKTPVMLLPDPEPTETPTPLPTPELDLPDIDLPDINLPDFNLPPIDLGGDAAPAQP